MRDATAGDPMTQLKWTHKSTRKICRALRRRGYPVGRTVVRRLLQAGHYSLRVNQKRLGGPHTPERDRQFRYIRRLRQAFLRRGWPVISVDTKKKELVGNFKNSGRSWTQQPRAVNDHDFPSSASGKALPAGVYDVGRNQGCVLVGISRNTPAFAVAAIRYWWLEVGRSEYRQARRLLIEADSGGANGNRCLLWKARLQDFADASGWTITVTHYPTGASKWNPVEHRMFSLISQNWAGQPLVSYETVLKHIRGTRSQTGFCCRARLDPTMYATKVKVLAEEAAQIRVRLHKVFPKWNYTIYPHAADRRRK